MKQLHFYVREWNEKKYLRDWVNWSGEVPSKDDVVILHFGDDNENEQRYKVLYRVFDGRKSEHIDIIVSLLIFDDNG